MGVLLRALMLPDAYGGSTRRSLKLLHLVRQLAPLLRQIEIHQPRFQSDREASGPFTVLRSLTEFLYPIDHTPQERAARTGCSASSLHTARISRNAPGRRSCSVPSFGGVKFTVVRYKSKNFTQVRYQSAPFQMTPLRFAAYLAPTFPYSPQRGRPPSLP